MLALAVRAAREDRSRGIDDGHLLLGLLREPGGLARRVLLDHGFDLAELERAAQESARNRGGSS
ncbi:Clp protease N-terminal domain-containing protein [Streptacidiphilus monticola]